LYTQITDIVNNFQIEVTPELLKEFKEGFDIVHIQVIKIMKLNG